MYNREHSLRETCQYFLDREATITEQAEQKLRERDKEVDEFKAQVNKYREQRELKDSELGKFTEAVYNNNLQTALEAIYISALSKDTPVSEESIELAHNLVENYIKEQGGARDIIRHKSGKTYLLDTIFEAVEAASKKDIELFFEAEKDDEEDEKERKKEKKEEDGSDEVDKEDIKLGDNDGDGVDDSMDSDFGTGSDNKKDDEASDAKEKGEEKEETKDEGKDEKEDDKSEDNSDSDNDDSEDEDGKSDDDDEDSDSKDSDKESEDNEDDSDDEEENDEDDDEEIDVEDLDKESSDNDEDNSEDNSDEDESDPVLDEPDTKETIQNSDEPETLEDEEPEEDMSSKEELFDKLESDKDVTDAVDIIAKRISDAEAKFIKKNAEDKEKIENIVNKVQDRIDAVTQDENSSDEEIEAEQEAARIDTIRRTNQIRNDRFHTVYEMMVRDNMEYIMKNQALTEAYSVDGKLDMTRVMDSSRTMYGWLETVNTIQLEKVNEEYIQKVLEGKI